MENFGDVFIVFIQVSSISLDMSLIRLLVVSADNGTLLTSLTSYGPSIYRTISRHACFKKVSPKVCGFFDLQSI